jgi:collagenase-like PrtC family protease
MEIGFHLPGLTRTLNVHRILIGCMERHPEWFRDNVKIASVFGTFPTSVWNGGRYLDGVCDEAVMINILRYFNDKGIPVRFTFTNPKITEEHLSDPFSNRQLQLADNGLNEVIVNSPILEQYIREKYPRFKLTSSTCKQIRNMDDLNAETERDYSLVVIDYNWNNKFEELAKIKHPERCEILVDACCIPNCPRRGEHYDTIGSEQIKYWENERNRSYGKKVEIEKFTCPHMMNTIYDVLDYETVVAPEDLYTKYVDMGFTQFKLEGRSSHPLLVLESYIYYLVKPEWQGKARLSMIYSLFPERSRGM